ncbi:hypothetical protein DY000_02054295 [Brassica cretica]|uniref:Remorin N-terminal domain-containing protein n=1 Tax=Brassica cretica TaxID=69181 RepID=A0ABQ7AKB8_BRACR|nr:hypothetical protein DY000_02054295 [Brassica cretica]
MDPFNGNSQDPSSLVIEFSQRRWSSPEPIIPVTPPSLVKETESDAPSASATDPHLATETTGTPPASAIIIISPQTTAFPSPATLAVTNTKSPPPPGSLTHELNVVAEVTLAPDDSVNVISEIEDSEAESDKDSEAESNKAVTNTKSPPPPGSLTHELNVVAEVTLAPDDSVNVISEIEDSEAESDKDSEAESNKGIAFVRSIGAWPKPLRFTPPHTPSEPATPRLTISEAKQKKGKLFPVQAAPQLPVRKFPPPAPRNMEAFGFLGLPG